MTYGPLIVPRRPRTGPAAAQQAHQRAVVAGEQFESLVALPVHFTTMSAPGLAVAQARKSRRGQGEAIAAAAATAAAEASLPGSTSGEPAGPRPPMTARALVRTAT